MNNMDIIAKFLQTFPRYEGKIDRYILDGDDGVEIYTTDGHRLMFIYRDEYDWMVIDNTRRV